MHVLQQDQGKSTKTNQKFNLTDVGNAKRFVHQHSGKIRYCWSWGQWLVWDGARWAIDQVGATELLAKRTAKSIFREAENESDHDRCRQLSVWAVKSECGKQLHAMQRWAQSEPGIPVMPSELDNDPWLLNLPNGTLDLQKGILRRHEQLDFITKLCPTEYDPSATCPKWQAFIDRIFEGKPILIGFVQRLLGYCLTGSVQEQVMPIFWGSGANGKSTLLETMLAVLGSDYATSGADELLLVKRKDTHPTVVADLFGKRLIVASESDENARLNEGLVKRLTGGDQMKARKMRQDNFEFSPTHKIFLLTNHRPQIRGTDDAIWRRLRLVPFSVTIPERERDLGLLDKLKSEASGILAWCVQGCLAWRRDGLGNVPDVQTATAEYREGQDLIGQWLTERCLQGSGFKAKSSQLYESYKGWSREGGCHPVSLQAWGERMVKSFERKVSNGTWYTGVGLIDATRSPTAGQEEGQQTLLS
jgi:putative DNA primase/helicase